MMTLKTLQLFENEEIMFKILARTPKFFENVVKKNFDVEKSNVGNRLKCVLAKYTPLGFFFLLGGVLVFLACWCWAQHTTRAAASREKPVYKLSALCT